MYCKHCGARISDDSRFCRNCGGLQDTIETEDSAAPVNTSSPTSYTSSPRTKVTTAASNWCTWVYMTFLTWGLSVILLFIDWINVDFFGYGTYSANLFSLQETLARLEEYSGEYLGADIVFWFLLIFGVSAVVLAALSVVFFVKRKPALFGTGIALSSIFAMLSIAVIFVADAGTSLYNEDDEFSMSGLVASQMFSLTAAPYILIAAAITAVVLLLVARSKFVLSSDNAEAVKAKAAKKAANEERLIEENAAGVVYPEFLSAHSVKFKTAEQGCLLMTFISVVLFCISAFVLVAYGYRYNFEFYTDVFFIIGSIIGMIAHGGIIAYAVYLFVKHRERLINNTMISDGVRRQTLLFSIFTTVCLFVFALSYADLVNDSWISDIILFDFSTFTVNSFTVLAVAGALMIVGYDLLSKRFLGGKAPKNLDLACLLSAFILQVIVLVNAVAVMFNMWNILTFAAFLIVLSNIAYSIIICLPMVICAVKNEIAEFRGRKNNAAGILKDNAVSIAVVLLAIVISVVVAVNYAFLGHTLFSRNIADSVYFEDYEDPFAVVSEYEEISGLQTLNLSSQGISDLGKLSKIDSITTLDLSNNNISDLTPLYGMHNLKEIVLTGNTDLIEREMIELAEKLPDCDVIYYDTNYRYHKGSSNYNDIDDSEEQSNNIGDSDSEEIYSSDLYDDWNEEWADEIDYDDYGEVKLLLDEYITALENGDTDAIIDLTHPELSQAFYDKYLRNCYDDYLYGEGEYDPLESVEEYQLEELREDIEYYSEIGIDDWFVAFVEWSDLVDDDGSLDYVYNVTGIEAQDSWVVGLDFIVYETYSENALYVCVIKIDSQWYLFLPY